MTYKYSIVIPHPPLLYNGECETAFEAYLQAGKWFKAFREVTSIEKIDGPWFVTFSIEHVPEKKK